MTEYVKGWGTGRIEERGGAEEGVEEWRGGEVGKGEEAGERVWERGKVLVE